jgi:hypothetical protein
VTSLDFYQWEQLKCSSLAPPRGIFYKTQIKVNDVSFHLQKSLEIFDKNSADKI